MQNQTIDLCSKWSYDDIKKSGYMSNMQSMYLSIFILQGVPMSHRISSDLVNVVFRIKVPERNGRIAELTDMGFLRKVDIIIDGKTKATVNRWEYTGRTEPFPQRLARKTCKHCDGCGSYQAKEYYDPGEKQQSDFGFDKGV